MLRCYLTFSLPLLIPILQSTKCGLTISSRTPFLPPWHDRRDTVGANKLLDVGQCLGAWRYSGLARLRIGHPRLTHGFLMERTPPSYCVDCLVPLTVWHLLVECLCFGDLHHRYLSGFQEGDRSCRLSQVLREECGRQHPHL